MEVLSNNEKGFILEAAGKGIRMDGRGLFDCRKLSINFTSTRGQVEVSLGDSLVLCSVDIFIDSPYTDRPNEGFLTFNVEFLPMAHPNFEGLLGANLSQRHRRFKNELSAEIERVLEKSIKKSRALNTESLCIVSGKHCWNVIVHMHILAHHGNLIDLCTQASVLALMHARVPDIKINPNKTIELLPVLKPLSLHFLAISVTFGFLKGQIAILDPEIREEAILEGKIVICMNVYGDILALQKSGAAALKEDVIFQCLDLALVKTKETTKELRKAVEKAGEVDVDMENPEIRVNKLLAEIGGVYIS
ncbi:hypothetical protein SteCoe_9780 [Stentor coeruleus]|uniref:Uncharacterized protein n=1 Tax=Stentor coeruleus TaxID=5963 RepID=A0A1R2CGY8_9CILI|nr:hypothetical protein SteCoe_9780 [Stentor coeruleus]